MALKKDDIKKLATLAKMKPEDLEKAIGDQGEVGIEIPEGLQVLTTDELKQRDDNTRNAGIQTGKELGIKEVRKAAGIEEGGSKDPTHVAQQIIAKGLDDAKIKPDEKVAQLTEQVGLLQKSIADKDAEITREKEVARGVQLDRKILSALPKQRSSLLTDDEYLSLIKTTHTFKEQDGTIVVERDGKALRDGKTQNVLPIADALSGIFTDRKGWLDGQSQQQQQGGRGGSDNNITTGAFTKKSDVIKHYEDQGISLNGQKGQEVVDKLAELKKANPEFDMNN